MSRPEGAPRPTADLVDRPAESLPLESGPAAPTKAAPKGLERRILTAVLLGVVVYAALVLLRGWRAIGSELTHFEGLAFLAALGLSLLNYALRFIKWEFYLRVLSIIGPRGEPRLFSRFESLLIFLSGFVLTVTPGKVGEVYKSVVLRDLHGLSLERTAPIVLAERITDLIGVIVLITVGSTELAGGLAWATLGAFLVSSLLLFISVPSLSRAILSFMTRLPGALGRLGKRVEAPIATALATTRTLTSAKNLVLPTALSIVGWSLEGLGASVILRGFTHQETPVLPMVFCYGTATLAGALVPVPGGLGVTEKVLEESMTRLLSVAGSIATPVMLLSRVATLWFAVFVGFVALFALRLRHPRRLG